LRQLIAFGPKFGLIFTLATCTLIVGMITGSRITMGASAAPAHLYTGATKLTQTCTSGFTALAGNKPHVYTCSSKPPVCSNGYTIHNDNTGFAPLTHNPRYEISLPFNGEFVYQCD
jgi:hypothetical protein